MHEIKNRNVWFTSDTHFFHKNIIKYCNRPFQTVEEMNEEMVRRWNVCVKPNDIVYHIGDVSFGKRNETNIILRRLNGEKYLIKGNHDGKNLDHGFFISVKDYEEIKINDQLIILSHYPMHVWNQSHRGSWMLHGHSHGTLIRKDRGKLLDVGVDNFVYAPVSFEEIKKIMDSIEIKTYDHHYQRA